MLNENMELSLGLLCYIKFLFNQIRMKCNGFRPFYTLSCYSMVNQISKFGTQFNAYQNFESSSADEMQSSGV